jgi:TrmH family RNA methyltransferase
MITSARNKRVLEAVRLKRRAMREKDRRFLVEGARAVSEAIASGSAVLHVFHSRGNAVRTKSALETAFAAGIRVHEVSPDVMDVLTSTVTPQGVVAVAEFVDVPLSSVPTDARLVPLLCGVADPGNAGTILRSADAAGADAVVVSASSVDTYNPKTVRASAGSLFHLPVVRGVDALSAVEELRRRGFTVLAADAAASTSLYRIDLTEPTAVLFGNEAWGLDPDIAELADIAVAVPIRRAESLNLAAAATVFLFEAARQRTARPPLARIVSGAAHDIRSPLAAVRGFGTTLLQRWDRLTEEQRRSMVESMVHDSDRMRSIVTQLVDAARLESGSLDLALGPTDLLEVAMAVRDEHSHLGGGGVEVRGDPALALADRERVRTILHGLVESAHWWGQEGPVMVIVSSDPGPAVTVARSKAGIDAASLPDLFLPRAPGTGQGSKVGLFVAKGLAEAHGGRLEARVDDAISFVVRLPPAPDR